MIRYILNWVLFRTIFHIIFFVCQLNCCLLTILPCPGICLSLPLFLKSCLRSTMSRRNLVDDSSGLGIVDLNVSSPIIFLDPTCDNEAWILYGRAGPLETEPLWEAGSTGFRPRCTQTDVSLHHLENLHPHRLGSFKDFRLNLETFPCLQTLVVHIITAQR